MPSAFLLRANQAALQHSKTVLLGCERWELAGVSQHGHEALERLPLLMPDLLLADLRLLDGPLLRWLLRLAEAKLRIPTLVWTRHGDDPALFPSLLLGVRGFLAEPSDSALLEAQLDRAHEGRVALHPALAREALARLRTDRLGAPLASQPAMAHDANGCGRSSLLSVAQQALLSLLAHGWLPQEIGRAWRLEAAEVERRVGQLLRLMPRLVPEPVLA